MKWVCLTLLAAKAQTIHRYGALRALFVPHHAGQQGTIVVQHVGLVRGTEQLANDGYSPHQALGCSGLFVEHSLVGQQHGRGIHIAVVVGQHRVTKGVDGANVLLASVRLEVFDR